MAPEPSPWQAFAGLATVGIAFVVATAGAMIGGYYLDRWLETLPVFTLIGLGLGIATGFREFFRMVKRAAKEDGNER
jgi:F0F1-type ATP synthase assembly protein I